MKKAFCSLIGALLASLILFGCGQRIPSEGSVQTEPETTESDEVKMDTANEADLTEDDLTIIRQDFSRSTEQGVLLAELYYDLVQLPETTEAYRKINASIQEDYQAFVNEVESPDFQQYIDNAEKSREEYGENWGNYFHTCEASVTTCEDGILSLRYGEAWYMGGVSNRNARGLSFDLKTGEPITLDSIAQTLPENADFFGYIKSHIFWTMTEESKIDSLTLDSLQTLQLKDLAFYLEDKELMIYINTYQLACGAAGSFPVETGLFVDQPQGEIQSVEGNRWYGLYPAEDGSVRLPIVDLSNDGHFMTGGAYYRSDAGVMIEGTYEIESGLHEIVYFEGTTESDGTYSTSGTYELIRIGDSIQLLQLGDDMFYKNSPHFTVWTLRTEVPM